MRRAQISIELSLVNDLAWNGHQEKIKVYADANNTFEAICAGFWELLTALQAQGHKLPGFGVKEFSCTPSAAGLTEEQKEEERARMREIIKQRGMFMWDADSNPRKDGKE